MPSPRFVGNRMTLRSGVSGALVARGYKREGRMHHLQLQPGVSFWVDTGPLGKRSDIAPFVGLRHDRIERLISELMGLAPDAWVGTTGANVGYILGKGYMYWEPPAAVETVLEAIEAALARLRLMATLEDLPRVWDIVGRDDPWWRYREIVALLIKGEHLAIVSRLAEAQAEFCRGDDDPICEQFLGFAQRLKAQLPH